MSDTPLYDQLVNERLGRGPTEFEGHDTWDESEEARVAFERGAAQARTQAEQGAGPERTEAGKLPPAAKQGPDKQDPEKHDPEKQSLEKGPERKQLGQQPAREQSVPGQKQDEGQAAAEPANAKAKAEGLTGDRAPGQPLTPA
jgi:hypothetical protein